MSQRQPHPLRAWACIAVALGGLMGSVAREVLAVAIPHGVGSFPWSTLFVNLVGSLLIGLLVPRLPQPSLIRPFLVTGVLGGFTTMSTFAVDFTEMMNYGNRTLGTVYLGATVAGGLGATAISASLLRSQPIEEVDVVEAGS